MLAHLANLFSSKNLKSPGYWFLWTMGIMGLGGFAMSYFYEPILMESKGSMPAIILGMILIMVTAVSLLSFLSPKSSSESSRRFYETERVLLEKERARLIEERRDFESGIRLPVSKEETDAITAEILQTVRTAASEKLVDDIRKDLAKLDISKTAEESAGGMLDRIYREIDALGRRGNVNLVLGFVTAISGIGLLAYMVLISVSQHADMQAFIMSFIPRLSTVAIIELFAYFFLRLYKSTLADIKYFQNEATNIESTLLALKVALKLGNQPEIKQAITALLAIDRNSPLAAGVTTRELEDAKLFKDPTTISTHQLAEILKALPLKKD